MNSKLSVSKKTMEKQKLGTQMPIQLYQWQDKQIRKISKKTGASYAAVVRELLANVG